MTLGKYIERLEAADPNQKVALGLGNAHSWRGSYEELAFEPVANTTVGQMLDEAKEAVGFTYTGYKGGDFKMTTDTIVHVENYGEWTDGGQIWGMLLDMMLTAQINH